MLNRGMYTSDSAERSTPQDFFDNPDEQKPVLGVKPYYVAAWQRIGDLAEAIERQFESPNGDTELVQKWAAEIGWQCSMIESLKEEEKHADGE